MRPLSPFCGTVLNAQLLTLPATISTSAHGVVTTQLSFLPPASSTATDVPASSDSLPATAQPPEPPPTTTKSNVSPTRVPPFCHSGAMRSIEPGISRFPGSLPTVVPRDDGLFPTASAGKPPLLRFSRQGRFQKANFR